MRVSTETIAAIATPPGRGGIGIVRVSGSLAPHLCEQITGKLPRPREAVLSTFRAADGSAIDSGITLYFPGPASFTGEDVVEFQGHGGPVVMDMLLACCVSLGARLARPGEFSERAFLNDKIDLSQAEAIADLIDSASQQAARGAMRSLQGEFSRAVSDIDTQVLDLRVYVEAAMDFPDEEIDFLADDQLMARVEKLDRAMNELLEKVNHGALLQEGINLVIVGRPNAGKSSLMNRLTGTDASIVTSVPGTTRDVVRESIHIEGIPVRLVDTAGIRFSDDEVEAEGVRRALGEIETADVMLVVIDASLHESDWETQLENLVAELGQTARAIVVLNKVDLLPSPVEVPDHVVATSAATGAGIDRLTSEILALIGAGQAVEGNFTARRRHVEAIQRARSDLEQAKRQLDAGAGEFLAEDLRRCHEALTEITGEFSSDDLLGRIFSSFCIGK